ncbi:MAG: RNA polymerase sigma factor RpoD/SigA [Planctomycetes bacterium]|nr:RNA polymerase sigma factor RpoD/SigA [Planctomycetota bacterium]
MKRDSNELVMYIKDINKYPLLSIPETNKLAGAMKRGNRLARHKLIRANLRLVVKIARKYLNRGLSFQDLIEDGNIGLMKAVKRFNPSKGRFSTYASWWIKQSIMRALYMSSKTIRLPCHVVELISRWKSVSVALSQKLGRFPEPYEVCETMNMSHESINLFKKTLQNGLSVSRPTSLDYFTESAYVPPHDTIRLPVHNIFTREESEWLRRTIENIKPKEALVLKMRYGLEEKQPPMTLRQIGKQLGLSYERIRQVEKNALRKLYYAISKRNE